MDKRDAYIIVGSGIAGLRTAIDLADSGMVTILTKAEIADSNSSYAQGGIAAAVGQSDNVDLHYADTTAAGAGLCEPEAVRVLVEEGPKEIDLLLRWGADFEKEGSHLLLSREGGHSVPRIVHGNGGLTGQAVVQALLSRVRQTSNVQIIPFAFLRDLIEEDGRVVGVQYQQDSDIVSCYGKATLVATGGGSRIYRETTNPHTATGDGLAAAYRAGAELRDLEFVQFHPTVLNLPDAPRFLLTEALRGEGARILDETGARFVDELRTRDEVSRAVYRKLTERPDAKVFLDVTHLPAETLQTKFRHVYTTCLQYGLDITRQPVPITPAAHYFMGGVTTDLYGRSSIPGLYAAGEVASTGVHGANRLASNSLLEALVFGGRTAEAMRNDPFDVTLPVRRQPISNQADLNPIVEQIREITWQHAGMVRVAERLKKGADLLKDIEAGLTKPPLSIDGFTVQNLLTVATLVHEAALARTESRGAHYREDFPEPWPTKLHSYSLKGQEVSFR